MSSEAHIWWFYSTHEYFKTTKYGLSSSSPVQDRAWNIWNFDNFKTSQKGDNMSKTTLFDRSEGSTSPQTPQIACHEHRNVFSIASKQSALFPPPHHLGKCDLHPKIDNTKPSEKAIKSLISMKNHQNHPSTPWKSYSTLNFASRNLLATQEMHFSHEKNLKNMLLASSYIGSIKQLPF